MYDKEFKNATSHILGYNHIHTRGAKLADGYSPDLTVASPTNDILYIIENERKSDRKAFLGDLIKAAYYCDKNKCPATLIIVMKETSNQTTIGQISNHLKKYFDWLQEKETYLKDVLLITDENYDLSVSDGILLGDNEFIQRCISLA